MKDQIALQKGDITEVAADAIVNAANNELLHGGGVAAAIARAGGSIITEESSRIAPIDIGEAAVTDAGKLKATYVIHAAVMAIGKPVTEQALRDAISNTYRRADELQIASLAMPSLGTGIGGFPIDRAADIQMATAREFLSAHPDFQKIIFVLHTQQDLHAYQAAFEKEFSK